MQLIQIIKSRRLPYVNAGLQGQDLILKDNSQTQQKAVMTTFASLDITLSVVEDKNNDRQPKTLFRCVPLLMWLRISTGLRFLTNFSDVQYAKVYDSVTNSNCTRDSSDTIPDVSK